MKEEENIINIYSRIFIFVQAQGGEEYVQLQAISKWDGILPVYTSGAIPFIDVTPNK